MLPHMQDILKDWAKVGTMLVVSHLMSGGNIQDPNWQRGSLFTLLGFTAYNVATRNLVDTNNFGQYKPIADDWAKVGTMLLVSRLLSGQPLSQEWMKSSLFTLLGFTAYNLVTKNFVKGENISGNKGIAESINDAAKFGTMFLVAQLLSGGSLQDQAWQRNVVGTIAGFAVYNLLVSGLLKL